MSNTDNSVFEDFKRITSQRINWIEFLSSEDSQVVKYAIKNMLRLESINLSLTKLLLILLSQNKDNRPTYNENIDKFRKIVEKGCRGIF